MKESKVHVRILLAYHLILMEQVACRLKTFRVIANKISLDLIAHVDEMQIV
jgi:hypothetical protein